MGVLNVNVYLNVSRCGIHIHRWIRPFADGTGLSMRARLVQYISFWTDFNSNLWSWTEIFQMHCQCRYENCNIDQWSIGCCTVPATSIQPSSQPHTSCLCRAKKKTCLFCSHYLVADISSAFGIARSEIKTTVGKLDQILIDERVYRRAARKRSYITNSDSNRQTIQMWQIWC